MHLPFLIPLNVITNFPPIYFFLSFTKIYSIYFKGGVKCLVVIIVVNYTNKMHNKGYTNFILILVHKLFEIYHTPNLIKLLKIGHCF